MAIELNDVKRIDDDKNWIYITLTVDGDTVRTTSVNPWNQPGPPQTGEALQSWCDNREDWFALNILNQMYPNARYQDTEGDTDLAKFTQWITNGHTNASYCSIAEHDTEESCLANDGKWTPEEVITKVPFTDSHALTGDMRWRMAEQLNSELQTYIYTKYDVGTQISLNAIYGMAATPPEVIAGLDALFAWISGVMEYYYTKKAAIRDVVDDSWRTVTWDYSTFDATDPDISLEALMGPQ